MMTHAVQSTFKKIGIIDSAGRYGVEYTRQGWGWVMSAASFACSDPQLQPGVRVAIAEFFGETFGPSVARFFLEQCK